MSHYTRDYTGMNGQELELAAIADVLHWLGSDERVFYVLRRIASILQSDITARQKIDDVYFALEFEGIRGVPVRVLRRKVVRDLNMRSRHPQGSI